ncbi:hypothetical protein HanIR_Chr06g0272581 [Helianthus annuus]|nr:hypothetical protein HanIR_Chr06g0272581 [Helianthus annuus]
MGFLLPKQTDANIYKIVNLVYHWSIRTFDGCRFLFLLPSALAFY